MVSRAGEKFFLLVSLRGRQWPCKGLKPDAGGGGGRGTGGWMKKDDMSQEPAESGLMACSLRWATCLLSTQGPQGSHPERTTGGSEDVNEKCSPIGSCVCKLGPWEVKDVSEYGALLEDQVTGDGLGEVRAKSAPVFSLSLPPSFPSPPPLSVRTLPLQTLTLEP